MKKVAVILNTWDEFCAFVEECEMRGMVLVQKIIENRMVAQILLRRFEVVVILSEEQGSAITETVWWTARMFGPSFYVNVGTAGVYHPEEKHLMQVNGIKDSKSLIPLLGLLVPRKVFSYDRIKIRNGRVIDYSNPLCPSAIMLQIAHKVQARFDKKESEEFRPFFINQFGGPINWSDKDSPLVDVLLKRYDEIAPFGVDMESYAFLDAIGKMGDRIPALIIRAVSDDILEPDNQKQRDLHRMPAARKASIFAIEFIKELSRLVDGPKNQLLLDIHKGLVKVHFAEVVSAIVTIISLFPFFFH